MVLLWSEARNAKGTVALGLVSCYLSSFTNPLATCEDVTKMKYMAISWGWGTNNTDQFILYASIQQSLINPRMRSLDGNSLLETCSCYTGAL